MFFPVPGIEVNPFVAFGDARVISFFTSMGGVSGAFLLLPFQIGFLGHSAPSVSATNQVFNIAAIFCLPVHTIAGAALMGTFIMSVAGVGFYQLLSQIYTHDWRPFIFPLGSFSSGKAGKGSTGCASWQPRWLPCSSPPGLRRLSATAWRAASRRAGATRSRRSATTANP
jgi:hypothetical protein